MYSCGHVFIIEIRGMCALELYADSLECRKFGHHKLCCPPNTNILDAERICTMTNSGSSLVCKSFK
jgi:hypothetical protein